jgi:dienelactone hydrolase
MIRYMLVLAMIALCGGAAAEELPLATGPYSVGTMYLMYTDSSRGEPFTDDTADYREISARVWYPADLGQEFQAAPYIPNLGTIGDHFGLPESFSYIMTYSMWQAAFVDSLRHVPVLIFSHGWGQYPEHFTSLMEDLASHGFVVFSIAHPYEAMFWTYPDFRHGVLDFNDPRIKKRLEESQQPEARKLYNERPSLTTTVEQDSLFREWTGLLPSLMIESMRLWADDISAFIGYVARLNRAPGILHNRMDPERIGVFGWSLGGIASALVCAHDKRCRAGIDIDGGLYGDVIDSTILVPFMFLSSERYRNYGPYFLQHVSDTGYAVVIANADHLNFSDYSVIFPSSDLMGDIDGLRMVDITRKYVRAFFDRHLNDGYESLLDGPDLQYPEVSIETKP